MQDDNPISFFLLDVIGVLVSGCTVLCFWTFRIMIVFSFYIITSCLIYFKHLSLFFFFCFVLLYSTHVSKRHHTSASSLAYIPAAMHQPRLMHCNIAINSVSHGHFSCSVEDKQTSNKNTIHSMLSSLCPDQNNSIVLKKAWTISTKTWRRLRKI